jgi:1-deoxy-D-xylulose-5-phosphate synthase
LITSKDKRIILLIEKLDFKLRIGVLFTNQNILKKSIFKTNFTNPINLIRIAYFCSRMESLLQHIESVDDLRKLNRSELPQLAKEIREFILDTLSVKPGHLGAGLGVVELSIALHYFYNTPEDLLIWDVGHQSYPHKILSGRKSDFSALRQLNGISGFPNRSESEFDVFGTGHSSTSISAIMGMAIANQLQNKSNQHIAVIGDASIASGMAWEALNHLGSTDLDVLIILNDNSIGIDPSVGALKEHFLQLTHGGKSIFEDLGFHYKGILDGHDFGELFSVFEELKPIKKPKLLHLKTIKGKGFLQAEKDQVKWHSPGLFNKKTGEISEKPTSEKSFQSVFGETLIQLFSENKDLIALTPAMLSGSNLLSLKEKFPQRVLDVGIAEQHLVTLAAGIATQGKVPYAVVYSTFLQRAYDQIIHDVALQDLPVVFCIDRAGIVGTDGSTHHGYFDISFLRSIPNMIVSAPQTEKDFKNLLFTAQFTSSPFSIRYPKGEIEPQFTSMEKLEIGKAIQLKKGKETAILTFGSIGTKIQDILSEIDSKENFSHFKFLFCKPLDFELLDEIFAEHKTIITFEDGILKGGFGDAVLEYAQEKEFKGKIIRKGYPDKFITHGSISELEKQIGLDKDSIKHFLSK